VPAAAELPATRSALTLPQQQARILGRRQLAWTAWVTALSGWLALVGLAGVWPALTIAATLFVGVMGVRPKRLKSAPLVLAAISGAALLASALGLSAVMAAGAAAGLMLVRLNDREYDRLDLLNGTLAGAAASGLGLWAAEQLVPGSVPLGLAPLFKGAIFGLVSAQALVPISLKWKRRASIPSDRVITMTLSEHYREAPIKSKRLYNQLKGLNPEKSTLEGVEEIACWVYRLSSSLQTLDRELGEVNPSEIQDRIMLLTTQAAADDDEFTRERRLATSRHLQQLIAHTERLKIERERMSSLQEYAQAYLEEARLGTLLARKLPGESAPVRLDEVLDRLRTHAKEGEARRDASWEIGRAYREL